MFKQIAMAAGLALAVAGCAVTGFSTSQSTLYRNSVVKVNAGDGHGSGVVIAKDTILTALHVVKGREDRVSAVFSNEDESTAKVTWTDEKLDLAIVKVEESPTSAKAVPINCDVLKWGQPLTLMGFPMNARYVVNQGYVASTDLLTDNKDAPPYLLPVDISLAPGQSGGPVFNADNELVGINDAVMIAPISMISTSLTGVGYIVPSSMFCEKLPK